MKEIQVDNLLNEARRLRDILSQPLANKVLEIDIKKDSGNYKELLLSLIRTLDQYVNKEKNLIYIGFLGHFSTGKSSTINSVLELWGTPYERKADQNPTDKGITLITHGNNSNLLLLMSREGSNLSVRTELIHSSLLENLVIADTPGSGDPSVIHEMVQDFLPICDHLFYFISGASPIDNADLPLLIQQAKELPFIPIKFMVTRTDEFRVRKLEWLSDENLDQTQLDLFLGKLISRLKESLKTDAINVDQFRFIDNTKESPYKILELQAEIKTLSTELQHEELAKIHGYKVEFFKKKLQTIKEYFLSLITEQVRQCNGFVKQAVENANRFDKSVDVNNEKLKEIWTKSELTFKEKLNYEKDILADLNALKIPISITAEKEISQENNNIQRTVESLANGYLGRIILDINNDLRTKIREAKQNIHATIATGNIAMADLHSLFPITIKTGNINTSIEIDFTKVNDSIKQLASNSNSILANAKSILRNRINDAKKIIAKEALINSLDQQYENGRKIFNESFDKYFEMIEMYKGVVLTKNNKAAIEKLRIGAPMDQYDVEFPPQLISDTKRAAFEDVYPSSVEIALSFKKSITSSIATLNEILSKLEKIYVHENTNFIILQKEEIDTSTLVVSLSQIKEDTINSTYTTHLNRLLNTHAGAYKEFTTRLITVKKQRRKQIFGWTLVGGAIALFTYLAFYFSKVIVPTNITANILLALLSTFIGNAIAYGFARIKNDTNKIFTDTKQEFIKAQSLYLVNEFGEEFWEKLSQRITDDKQNSDISLITHRINDKIKMVATNVLAQKQDVLNQVQQLNKECWAIIEQHKSQLDNFYSRFTGVFTNIDDNLYKVNTITKKIRTDAIQPSLKEIERSATDLTTVKQQIET